VLRAASFLGLLLIPKGGGTGVPFCMPTVTAVTLIAGDILTMSYQLQIV
jgi:hypothetical protein